MQKTWPAGWADSKLRARFGKLMDDVITGLYGGMGIQLVADWVIWRNAIFLFHELYPTESRLS